MAQKHETENKAAKAIDFLLTSVPQTLGLSRPVKYGRNIFASQNWQPRVIHYFVHLRVARSTSLAVTKNA